MFFKRTTVILPLLALASASTLPIAREEVRAVGTIPALLLHAGKGVHGLSPRQTGDQCDIGYHHCDGTEGCCQIGYYCGTWDGKRGCCPVGESCIANDDPCEYEDYFPCSGETFCCPNGSTCSRDSLGNPRCSTGSSGSGNSFSRTLGSATGSVTRTFTSGTATTPTTTPRAAFTSTEDDIFTTSSRTQNLVTSVPSNVNTAPGSSNTLPPEKAFGNGAGSNAAMTVWVIAGAAINLFLL